MDKYKIIKVVGYYFLIFSLVLFQTSCQKSKEFIGYNDLLYNSPTLLWGSSIEEVKSKYPNIEKNPFGGYYDDKNNLLGQIKSRVFNFYNNQLFSVEISYGTYSDDDLNLLKNNFIKKYGSFNIEENGTIEDWFVINNENNQVVFVINKLQNNMIYCSYINPPLREENYKTFYK